MSNHADPIRAFISFAFEDEEYKNELVKRLSIMEVIVGAIEIWEYQKTTPSRQFTQDEISERLKQSDLVLYLVSRNSLASNSCYEELKETIDARIAYVPIILETCDWKTHPWFNEVRALPDNGIPVNKWDPQSKGWQNAIEGIWEIILEIKREKDRTETKIVTDRPMQKHIML